MRKKKAEARKIILDCMDEEADHVCQIIKKALSRIDEKLDDPDQLSKTSVVQLATTLGIAIDKFTKADVQQSDSDGSVEDLTALGDLLK